MKKAEEMDETTACITLVITGAFWFAMSFWTDRNLDFWLTQIKGEEVNCPWVLSFIATAPMKLSFIGNLFGEIGRLAL